LDFIIGGQLGDGGGLLFIQIVVMLTSKRHEEKGKGNGFPVVFLFTLLPV